MRKFTINIVTLPAITTAGYKIITTMANAKTDCAALWSDKFGPVMDTVPADPAYPDQSFGVCLMDQPDTDAFTYWAVTPLKPGASAPAGMGTLDIAAGPYAECKNITLAELGDAYTYIYSEWAKTQDKYALNMQGACLESYSFEFMNTGKLNTYCPLIEQ